MKRITTSSVGVVLMLSLAVLPTHARAGGCEVLADPADRARCTARAEARVAARAEVRRSTSATVEPAGADRSAAWQGAIDEAGGVDVDAILEPRPIAAVGGLAWFALVLRRRRRAQRRTA